MICRLTLKLSVDSKNKFKFNGYSILRYLNKENIMIESYVRENVFPKLKK